MPFLARVNAGPAWFLTKLDKNHNKGNNMPKCRRRKDKGITDLGGALSVEKLLTAKGKLDTGHLHDPARTEAFVKRVMRSMDIREEGKKAVLKRLIEKMYRDKRLPTEGDKTKVIFAVNA